MTIFPSICLFVLLFLLFSSSSYGNFLPQDSNLCQESLFVKDVAVIDAAQQANCIWRVRTDENYILVFTLQSGDGNSEQAQDFVDIHDGLDEYSPILLLENQKVHKDKVSGKHLPSQALYSTHSAAIVRFKKTPTSPLRLKIQKAVDCPLNLDSNSECGRVVDEVSCYCLTNTTRDHASQMTYCNDNQMKLLAVETKSEETAIYAAWGTTTVFWTSGNDSANEGIWVWESTNATLPCPGYANWANLQPDNAGNNEDCLALNWRSVEGWNDYPCSNSYQAICEAHP